METVSDRVIALRFTERMAALKARKPRVNKHSSVEAKISLYKWEDEVADLLSEARAIQYSLAEEALAACKRAVI